MNISKILNLIISGIVLIGSILFVRVLIEDKEVIESNVDVQNSVISPIIYFSLWLLIASIVLTIGLSLYGLYKNPENIMNTLKGVGVLAVLLLISYLISDSEAVYNAAGGIEPGGEEGSSVNRWVGTGIWYSIILCGIATLFFVWDLVKGLIKS